MLSHPSGKTGRSLPPPPVAVPVLPDPAALLLLPWSDSVWSTYQGLLISATPVAAGNYLALQWRMDFDPAYSRTVRLKIDSHGTREKAGAIRIALLMILHPYQQPLSMDCLRQELTRYDIGWANLDTLRRILSQFIDQKQLRQFASPFRGRQLVYCSEMYRSEPAIGDRVLDFAGDS